MTFKDKIKSFKRIPADKLIDNPDNWRTHPEAQRNALSAVLSEIGFVGAVIVRPIAGGNYEIIDGHLRKELMTGGKVPALVCDLTDEEVKILLASYDPLAGMAEADTEALGELLKAVETESEEIGELLKKIGENLDIPDDDQWKDAAGGIPTGEKSEFCQMTFTLHDSQAEVVKEAIDKAKKSEFENEVNENSNGNALFVICSDYNGKG